MCSPVLTHTFLELLQGTCLCAKDLEITMSKTQGHFYSPNGRDHKHILKQLL